jgi:hypothetical protein
VGKTPKPLRILTIPEIAEWDEMEAYRQQGHVIEIASDFPTYDLILSPRAWLMDEAHRKFLDLAIANARKVRYPAKKGG